MYNGSQAWLRIKNPWEGSKRPDVQSNHVRLRIGIRRWYL